MRHAGLYKNGGLFNVFSAFKDDAAETLSCSIIDSDDNIILLAEVSSFMRRGFNHVNGYFEQALLIFGGNLKAIFTWLEKRVNSWLRKLCTLDAFRLETHLGSPRFCQNRRLLWIAA